MAAHINNTASQGASFTVGVVVGGGHEQEKGWGGGKYQGKISPLQL